MDVRSLGFRTELALLQQAGSLVEDHGTHLVVRTPDNPVYYWGNFLLLADPPASVEEVADWEQAHRRAFPNAGHVSLGIDRPRSVPDDAGVLRAAGLEVDEVVAMTATSVRPPDRPPREADVRQLGGDSDWAQQVDLMLSDEDAHLPREFGERKVGANRRLVEAGTGAWWGAFDGGRLVSSLGIFAAGDALARFQAVKTRADHRNRGLAGELMVTASRWAQAYLGAERLVMCADPTYSAIRVYRAVGFVDGGTHLEATRSPEAAGR